jgi:3-hydroxybutyryl-CoA dehydratase
MSQEIHGIQIIKVGDRRTFSKEITDVDVRTFADISGDYSSIHLDEEFARTTILGGRVAHGMLLAGFISAAVSRLPGVIIYISQTLLFVKPARVGDLVEASVEVLGKIGNRDEFWLKTDCRNKEAELLIIGEARVKATPPV